VNKRASSLAGFALLVGLLLAQPALAEKDSKEQVRSLQQRVRASEQAKAQLAQQKAELDQQLKAGSDKLEATRRSAEAAERKRSVLAKELETAAAEKAELAERLVALEAKLAATEVTLADSSAKLDKTAGLLGRSELNNRQLVDTLGQRTQSLAECSSKNENLYQVGASLMGELAAKGAGGLLGKEPVTGLARVALENKVEEYRDQLEQQRLAQAKAQEDAQRRATMQWLDEQRALREQAEQRQAELDRAKQAKLKQQSDLDKWTRKIKSMFDNLEW